MQLHHIGLATADIDASLEKLREVYEVASVGEKVRDEEQKATLCYVKTKNGVDIELISGEMVADIVKKGISYYHLCFQVPGLEAEVERLRGTGAVLVSPPKDAVLFGGKKVAFLHTKLGLVELLEE